MAFTSTTLPRLLLGVRLARAGVALERARRSELAELVADHVLADVNRQEAAAVVHREGVADHLGDDRRAARPRLDRTAVVHALHRDLLQHAGVHEGTFLD